MKLFDRWNNIEGNLYGYSFSIQTRLIKLMFLRLVNFEPCYNPVINFLYPYKFKGPGESFWDKGYSITQC